MGHNANPDERRAEARRIHAERMRAWRAAHQFQADKVVVPRKGSDPALQQARLKKYLDGMSKVYNREVAIPETDTHQDEIEFMYFTSNTQVHEAIAQVIEEEADRYYMGF